MEPIINPWFFYFAEVSDTLKLFSQISGSILSFAVALFTLAIVTDPDEYTESFVKLTKYLGVLCGILLLTAFLIPSSSTLYKMEIARHITPNNVEYLDEGIDTLIDKIVEADKKLRENLD